MSDQFVGTSILTLIAPSGGMKKGVAVDSKGAIANSGTSNHGVNIVGFANTDAAAGQAYALIIGPSARAIAGAALDGTNTFLKTDANGHLIAGTAGTDILAARLKPGQTATAAGETIEVLPRPS